MTVLELSRDQAAALIKHAEEESPNECCGLLAGRNGRVERLVTDEQIEQARITPPQTTRAKIRSDFIRFANERNKSYDVGWSYLKLNDRYQRTILCKDPFRPRDPRVDEMINSY